MSSVEDHLFLFSAPASPIMSPQDGSSSPPLPPQPGTLLTPEITDLITRTIAAVLSAKAPAAGGTVEIQPFVVPDTFKTPASTPQPPPTTHNGEHLSLTSRFSKVAPSVLLEVTQHVLHPYNLYKLDRSSHDKLAEAKNSMDIENGSLTVRERVGSVKDYPNFISLLKPLLVYFHILSSYASSSGNTRVMSAFASAEAMYLDHITNLYQTYKWSAVLAYHRDFFLDRCAEMRDGFFAGWLQADTNLMATHLLGHPLPPVAQTSKKASATSSPTTSKSTNISSQPCFAYNSEKGCSASPCSRIHKCRWCDASDHIGVNCTQRKA